MGINYTPHTWTINELVLAATLNAEIRDLSNGLQAAWTGYTPAWTGSTTNPTLGNGTLTGKFLQIGKTVFYEIHLIVGSTTTFGSGTYRFSLPTTPNNATFDAMGRAVLRDVSAPQTYTRAVVQFGSNTVQLNDEGGNSVTPTVPFTLANTDLINISGNYESA